MKEHIIQFDWEQEYLQTILDASRINTSAIANLGNNHDLIKALIEAQSRLADALTQQSMSLKMKCNALAMLHQGNVDGFLAQYNKAIESTLSSIKNADKWVDEAASTSIYDSYESICQKIAAKDRSFSLRNPYGVSGVISKMMFFISKANGFVDGLREKTKDLIANIKSGASTLSSALSAFVKKSTKMTGDLSSIIADSVKNVADATGDIAYATVSPIYNPIANLMVGGKAYPRNVTGAAAAVDRVADRYWDSLNMAMSDNPDEAAVGLHSLERQILAFGNPNIPIAGRDKNGNRIHSLMDMVLIRADYTENLHFGNASPTSPKWSVAAIMSVLDLLDKYKAINLSHTPEEAEAIRRNLASKVNNADPIPVLTNVDRSRMKM
jgi:hypothetical protein